MTPSKLGLINRRRRFERFKVQRPVLQDVGAPMPRNNSPTVLSGLGTSFKNRSTTPRDTRPVMKVIMKQLPNNP